MKSGGLKEFEIRDGEIIGVVKLDTPYDLQDSLQQPGNEGGSERMRLDTPYDLQDSLQHPMFEN